MWTATDLVETLEARDQLWEPVGGSIGLRGALRDLFERLEAEIGFFCRAEAPDEWRMPPAIGLETLERADYFASFPQWLTVASHLTSDAARLEELARSSAPADAARTATEPCEAALAPAVCYHVYPRYGGHTITSPTLVTVQGTCWRHEGERLFPLARGWAFTMREIVCLGTMNEVEAFRRRGMARTHDLLARLGLSGAFVPATDPFFAPTARGRKLLQQVKGLKDELRLSIGPDEDVAAASFNHHERYFGEAFDIRLPDGSAAATGCVAFGLERWLLAFLVRHGPDPEAWPLPARSTAGRDSLEVGS